MFRSSTSWRLSFGIASAVVAAAAMKSLVVERLEAPEGSASRVNDGRAVRGAIDARRASETGPAGPPPSEILTPEDANPVIELERDVAERQIGFASDASDASDAFELGYCPACGMG